MQAPRAQIAAAVRLNLRPRAINPPLKQNPSETLKTMSKKVTEKNENPLFTHHASWAVIDAWLAIPPCTYKDDPYCHVDCPYFNECNPPEEDMEEDWG